MEDDDLSWLTPEPDPLPLQPTFVLTDEEAERTTRDMVTADEIRWHVE